MTALARHRIPAADAAPVLAALTGWTPADVPEGGVHPGDLGWHFRFADAKALLWTAGDVPVAAGFLDSHVLRVTTAPTADRAALAADVASLLQPADSPAPLQPADSAALPQPADSPALPQPADSPAPLQPADSPALPQLIGDAVDGLPMPGWDRDPDGWAAMSWTPRPVTTRATRVTEADAPDRVLVQRSAFKGSTFTLDRWHTMNRSPAAPRAVDMLVRTPSGEPAAAATGWFAGPGRCALLEPVGTHAEHRGHGYGRDVVRGTCAALAALGASAVAVVTPAANHAAVALYRSAGFSIVRENHDWVRPRPA
jgi:ribosomal protein S18 acetylase RimI-like enzyme